MVALEIETSARDSMLLDTTGSQSPPDEFKTPNGSRPSSQDLDVPPSPTYSGSDYSQSDSRPNSVQLLKDSHAGEDKPFDGNPEAEVAETPSRPPPPPPPPPAPTVPLSPTVSKSDYSQPHTPLQSRPASVQPQSPVTTRDEVEEPDQASDTISQSPFAALQRPRVSRTLTDLEAEFSEAPEIPKRSSRRAQSLAPAFEEVSLEDPPATPTADTMPQPLMAPDFEPAELNEEQELEKLKVKQPFVRPPRTSSRNASRADIPLIPSTSHMDPLAELDFSSLKPSAFPRKSLHRPQLSQSSNYSTSPPHSPKTPTMELSPMTSHDVRMSIDSLQSIALSEISLGYDRLAAQHVDDALSTPRVSEARHTRIPSSLEILQNAWRPPLMRQSTFFDSSKDMPPDTPVDRPHNGHDEDGDATVYGEAEVMSMSSKSSAPSVTVVDTTSVWRSGRSSTFATPKRGSSSSSDEDIQLDWLALDKTEEQEKWDKDLAEGAEDESTAFLLARLEQENAKFSADPKSTAPAVAINKNISRVRSKTRPPSMAQLKRLVSQQPVNAPSIRDSVAASDTSETLPDEPPPMTELEFWTALVQDYPSTASRLPTLTTTKIRAGIPLPLRGVVWSSMSGAREKSLEEAFEKLKDEKSPYEGIINKDVGRSFPGVELFRDAEGEGQKMLGRVLKCFSLYDKDIGYCQGLGFLVGPLLMNMGEKEAFCVLVRLMDHYALRASFLPSLSGLHMRIFQFSTLLAQHHPQLSEHLTSIGVEPAYLSQWFLSCFAVTCPLAMLFRIYDVIFAEGANETVMRVALALFRRNEATMMATTEFEEVMQLLLGRALWDVYGCNADDLVDDFTSLGNIITHQRLQDLEREFDTKDSEVVGHSAGFLPDVQAAASRFLGRLWAPSHASTPSKDVGTTLSPQTAEKGSTPSLHVRTPSFLRMSPSKQSLGAINDSAGSEGSTSSGSTSLISTAATDSEVHDSAARESQADSMSMKSKPESLRTVSVTGGQQVPHTPGGAMREQQELHSQIEDLLMALSEMQREHAQMAAMLQKEREERNDDHRVVRKLVTKLDKGVEKAKIVRSSMPPPARRRSADTEEEPTSMADKRSTLPPRPRPQIQEIPKETPAPKVEAGNEIPGLLELVQSRLDSNARFSASFESKAQLRSTLARTREQLTAAEMQAKDLTDRAESAESSLATFQPENEILRSEVEELRIRVNDDFKEKKKLELTIEKLEIQMRMEAKSLERKERERMVRAESSGEVPTLSRLDIGAAGSARDKRTSISSAPGAAGGLRELRLSRRDSASSVQSIRSFKSRRQTGEWVASPSPVPTAASEASSSPPVAAAPVEEKALPPVPATVGPAPLSTFAPAPTPAPVPNPTAAASASHTPSSSLSVPSHGHTRQASLFSPRTTSLATKAVFATEKHEPVPDEALLLELVNAKTAEAQARQEVDELKKALMQQRRRADETLAQFEAETLTAKAQAELAREEAEKAKDQAKVARAEVFDASPMSTPMITRISTPTPAVDDEAKTPTPSNSGSGTPIEKPEPKKAETAPAGGNWFWSRRTASTTKAGLDRAE